MRPAARHARRQLRDLRRNNQARHQARRAVNTGTPQTMRTHLLALGIPTRLAKTYAGTVSRNIPVAADQTTVKIKLKGRRTAHKPAYRYTTRQIQRALHTYVAIKGGPKRPADKAAFYRAGMATLTTSYSHHGQLAA